MKNDKRTSSPLIAQANHRAAVGYADHEMARPPVTPSGPEVTEDPHTNLDVTSGCIAE